MNSPTSIDLRATVDLHCHVLPAWDDGPEALDVSLTMVQEAAAAGIETIVATPHVGRQFRRREKAAEEIPQGVESLQAELDARAIPVKIVSGAEIMLGAVDLLDGPELKAEWTVGGLKKYMLIESSLAIWPDFAANLMYELSLRGVTPMIVHPERYINVQKDQEIIARAVSQGAVIQVTAEHLMGRGGKPMQACALQLLRAGLVHLIASDGHGPGSVWPQEAAGVVLENVGVHRARQILEGNPRAVLTGARLPQQAQVQPAAAKGGWAKFWKKRG